MKQSLPETDIPDMPDQPNKVGRPTDYKPEYCEKIVPLGPLGCTDKQVSTLLNVTEKTVYNWKNEHPEFLQAINLVKLQADMEVSYSLYRNATRNNNVQAQMFWLKNRQSEVWREKQDVDLRTPDGIQISAIDASRLAGMSDEEIAQVREKMREAIEIAQKLQIEPPK